jgi:hypothetical protein
MKNTLLCNSSVLPPQKPIADAGSLSDRIPQLPQSSPKIVAWGTGCIGNRKRSPPLPVKNDLLNYLKLTYSGRVSSAYEILACRLQNSCLGM